MTKRKRSCSSTSEGSTVILDISESLSAVEKITESPDDHSILIQVGKRARYRVSKCVLTEVRSFREFVSRERESSTYHLPDDDPFAIRTLFLIIHQRLQRLPPCLLLSQLVDLAIVCDRYDVAETVVPHVESRRWVENIWEANKICGKDWVAWFKVLRGFYLVEKNCDKLSTVLDVMAANTRAVDNCWIFEWNGYKCNVTDIDYSTRPIMDLSLCLEIRRQELWQKFRRACACLHDTLLRIKSKDSSIDRLPRFQNKLQEDIPSSVTVVVHLKSLKEHLGADAIGLEKFLVQRVEYLHAGS